MTAASEKLLADLASEQADTRYAAWVKAAAADPEIVPGLGKLLVAEEPGVRKAGDEALKKLVHAVGKDPANPRRAAVVKGLLELTGATRPKWVRTVALRHLSGIGGDEVVPAVARILLEPDLQEEAIFCLERIPGKTSTAAILDAWPKVRPDFQPRILAALGHRRDIEAAPLAAKTMGSPNLDLAIAGMKAAARIGQNVPGIDPPDFESLGDWQKIEYSDSVLRFADAQAAQGLVARAIGLYKRALARPDEHLQCAALIGLGKLRSTEAAALVQSKLDSNQRSVRITAGKVWASMPKA